MSDTIKYFAKYVFSFISCFFILFSFTIAVTYIPTEKIKPKMLESAEYMCQGNTMYLITDWIRASQIDHFADCITLSISYHFNGKKPLESAMWASYREGYSKSISENLVESVKENLPATQEYLRYWHGSAVLMRILHLFWSIQTIYIVHAFLMITLGTILILLLAKNGFRSEAISFMLSMFIVSVWYVPFSLEYTYCFLCMLLASIVGVVLSIHKKEILIGPFFLITGMVIVYFDFLTCETLTLLIPLLLICRIQRNKKSKYELWYNACKDSIAWLIGYVGMWTMKWISASIILKINVMPYVSQHINERLSQAVIIDGITGNDLYDAVTLNLKKLIPYEYGIYGAVALIILIVFFFVIPVLKNEIVLKKRIQFSNCALYLLLGTIPYIRYMVLRNHSIGHSFFTYRAQASTILALCFITLELVETAKNKPLIDIFQLIHGKAGKFI